MPAVRAPLPLARVLLYRLLLAYLLFTVVVSGALAVLEYRRVRAEVSATLQSLATTFAPVTQSALWDFQNNLLDSMASGLGAHEVVVRVDIRNQNGQRVNSWAAPNGQQASPQLTVRKEFVRPDGRGNGSGGTLGSLEISSSEEVVAGRMRQALIYIVVLASALFVFLGGVLWLLAQALVVQPLSDFSRKVRELSHADMQQPIDMGPAAVSEIDDLQQGFNQLMRQVQSARTQVEEHNVRLEQRVTERTQEIEDKEHRLYNILSGTRAGTWEWNVQTGQVFINPRWAEMVGWTVEELAPINVGTWQRLVHPQDMEHATALLVQNFAGKLDYYDCELRMLHRDGHWVWVLTRGSLISRTTDGEPLWMAGTHLDISELKRATLALQDAKELAESASRTKSDFLATMSHEIRTPMNGILGMLKLLEQTELTVRQLDYSRKARGATQALISIVNDILDFSKVEAGKMQVELEPFTLGEVLRDLSVLLSANQGSKNIEVLFDVQPLVPENLVGDPMRLRQVLLNLAGNALKFTEEGEVVVSIRRQDSAPGQARLRFSVQDTGVGIAQDKLTYIFEGFSQAESSTTRRYGGTGLGLAISRKLVELMGGQLQVESTLGRGSRFFFELPFALGSSAALPVANPSAAWLATPRRVLVVDDNPLARELLQHMTESLGWTVQAVSSGVQALAAFQAHGTDWFDLILLDWRMPEMDGLETARQIRGMQQQQRVPVIIMVSAYGREILVEQTQSHPALLDAYLVKPITASMLVDAVVEATSGNQPLQGRTAQAPRRLPLQGLRLLVVEDNLLNQQVAEELLGSHGATVQLAGGGQEGVAMALAAEPAFDAILMDMQMPDMDGLEATRRILAHAPMRQVPIIAMTANAMESDKAACFAAGMVDHVSKPIDLEKLIAGLLRHTGRERRRAAALHAQASSQSAGVATDSDLAVLDINRAVALLGGNHTLYTTVANRFCNDGAQQLKDVAQNAMEQRWSAASRAAHTLKGLAGTVGAFRLAAVVARSEQVLKDLAANPADSNAPWTLAMAALQQAFDATVARIASIVVPVAAAPTTTATEASRSVTNNANPAALASTLQELHALLRSNDMRALSAFADIRQSHGLQLGHPGAALEAAVQNLRFDEALGLCDALLADLRRPTASAPPAA